MKNHEVSEEEKDDDLLQSKPKKSLKRTNQPAITDDKDLERDKLNRDIDKEDPRQQPPVVPQRKPQKEHASTFNPHKPKKKQRLSNEVLTKFEKTHHDNTINTINKKHNQNQGLLDGEYDGEDDNHKQ